MKKENKTKLKVIGKLKKRCPRCNKVKRTKCFVYNRLLKMDVCRMCNKSIGSNKFYIPLKERKKYIISKYGMSDQEKSIMIKKAMHQGMDFKRACKKVNREIYGLRTMRKRKYQQRRELYNKKKNGIIQNKNKQKEFLKGLKQ